MNLGRVRAASGVGWVDDGQLQVAAACVYHKLPTYLWPSPLLS